MQTRRQKDRKVVEESSSSEPRIQKKRVRSSSPQVVSKNSKSKKTQSNVDYKKGQFNRSVKIGANTQLEGRQAFNNQCCTRCTDKELIRAANVGDLKMYQAIINSNTLTTVEKHWGPDRQLNFIDLLFRPSGKGILQEFLKHPPKIEKKIQTKCYLQNISTGFNRANAYGAVTRVVTEGRGNRVGNNAFASDISDEENAYKLFTQDIDFKILEQLIAKGIYDMDFLEQGLPLAIESGNYKIAGSILSYFKRFSRYMNYNDVHLDVLNGTTNAQAKKLESTKKMSVLKKGDQSVTPLHLAAINPNATFLEVLLEISHEQSIVDERLRKPIHYAAACQSDSTVKLLISRGIDIREGDNQKTTPLMIAAQYGRLHNVKLLLNEDTINQKNRQGVGALHYAALNGHVDIVKYLISEGSDINLTGPNKSTALILASTYGHLLVVEYLLEEGASVIKKDKYGRSAAIMAARNGNYAILGLLLQKGAEFNGTDSSKNTALHYAAAYGFVDCVELLISAGADINLQNSWNLTPISVAIQKGHKRIVQKFLTYKECDVNCRDTKGRTLIANEVLKGSLEQLELLCSKKADIHIPDLKGQTPLHHAAKKSVEKFEYLLNKGADVNAVDKNNKTPFVIAIESEQYEIAQLILTKIKVTQPLIEQIIQAYAFYNEQGCALLQQLMNRISVDDSTYELLQKKFTETVQVYGLIELKRTIKQELKQKKAMEIEKDPNEDSEVQREIAEIEREDEEDEEDEEDQDDDKENSENDDENEDGENEDDENENENDDEEDNENSDEDDKSDSDKEDETNQEEEETKSVEDQRKKYKQPKTFLFKVNGKAYSVKFQKEKSLTYIKYSSEDFVKEYKIKKNKKKKANLSLVKQCEQIVINKVDRIQKLLISLNPSITCNVNYPIWPVSDPHKFAYKYEESFLYSLDDFIYSNQRNVDGDTVDAILALRGIRYRNVDNVNNLNQVPLFRWINVSKVEDISDKILKIADPNFTDLDHRNALHHATMNGTNEILYQLIKKGGNQLLKDKFGRTPLFYAFIHYQNNLLNNDQVDDFDFVTFLNQDKGDTIDIYGRSALHYAACTGACMSARQLLQRGANINLQDRWGNTPLTLALSNGHADFVIMLLDNHAKQSQIQYIDFKVIEHELLNNNLKKPIIVQKYDEEKVKNKGSDDDDDDDDGDEDDSSESSNSETDSQSSEESQEDQFMKESNKNYSRYRYRCNRKEKENDKVKDYQITNKYVSLFWMACKKSYDSVQYLLLANGYPIFEALEAAISQSLWDVVLNILMKFHSFNQLTVSQHKQTILHLIAKQPDADVSKLQKYLILHSMKDTLGRIPLHYAAEQSNQPLIKLLLPQNDFSQDNQGDSALSLAIRSKEVDLKLWHSWNLQQEFTINGQLTNSLIYLIKYKRITEFDFSKFDINARDGLGQTSLHAAIYINNTNLVKQIITHPTFNPVNHIDNQNKTPIHYVVQPLQFGSFDNLNILKLLLPLFDHNQKDSLGSTALDYASLQDQSALKAHLIKIGTVSSSKPLRRANTSVITSIDFPEEVDYQTDAMNFIQDHAIVKPIERDQYAKQGDEVIYSYLMTKVDVLNGKFSKNVFYKMQLLHERINDVYVVFTRWGRIGSMGQYQHTPFQLRADAEKEFAKIYREKTGNNFNGPEYYVKGKYQLLKTKLQKYKVKLHPFNFDQNNKSPIYEIMSHFASIKLMQTDAKDQFSLPEDAFLSLEREQLLEGQAILNQLLKLATELESLQGKSDLNVKKIEEIYQEIGQLTNRYYENIPTDEDRQIRILQRVEQVETQLEKLDCLLNFEVASKIIYAAQNKPQPIEYCYQALNVRILPLGQDDQEFQMIQRYAQGRSIKAFCVERRGEVERFRSLPNRMLLWHGSRVSNFMGILALGLKIAPKTAHGNGALFGTGLYFADSFDKSANYTSDTADKSKKRYLLLCEVSLGKQQEVLKTDKFKINNKLNSVKVIGKKGPDPNQVLTLVNGCKVPIGDIVTQNEDNEMPWNEFVIYKEDQVRIRYIVQFHE